VDARLLLEPVERLACVPERSPGMRGSARHFSAPEVLRGDTAVPCGTVELVRRFLAELGHRVEAGLSVVGRQGSNVPGRY
jgi:hypothetical protein